LIWEASDLATTILRHDGFMDDEVEWGVFKPPLLMWETSEISSF
jgi:hypothetical protein